MKIKICGLTQVQNANEVAQLNPDFIGCIFSTVSKRQIALEQAQQINHPKKIGVFVNQSINEIKNIAENCNLYGVQLHGDESASFCLEIKHALPNLKIIKAFSVANVSDLEKTKQYNDVVDYFLFDTKGKYLGGNGTTFNWQILNELETNKPYFLAGGIEQHVLLELKNVKNKPFAIDANSKLEDAIGLKNINKTKQLINYVQSI